MTGSTSLDPRPNPRGRVWGKTLPGSVLSAGMPPSVLMREWTSLQPISVRVRLMTGSEYTVEHRNFENWSSTWPIMLKIWKRKFVEFRNRHIPARHFRARLFLRPFHMGCVWGPDYESTVQSMVKAMKISMVMGQLHKRVVLEPDPWKNWKEGLGDRPGWKCTMHSECSHVSDWFMVACLCAFINCNPLV